MPQLPFIGLGGQRQEDEDPQARAFPLEADAFRPAREEVQVQGMREDLLRAEPVRREESQGDPGDGKARPGGPFLL